jgi:ABC-type uncharacterized transport system ATPase subunit
VLRRLIEEGRTAVLITHKLREVMAICQRATVLRRGKVVGVVEVSETQPEQIAQMMVGHDLTTVKRHVSASRRASQPVLSVRDLHAADDRGLPAVRGVTFTVNAGEIIGLAGVEGNGQHELMEALVGLRTPTQGNITLNNVSITRASNRQHRTAGMAVIPEDRTHQGLSLPSTLDENIIATRYHAAPFSAWGILRPGRMRKFARQAIQQFDIRVRGPNVRLRTLSGGNAQKVVIARELAESPEVLIAAQPTRGLDVGATQFVHHELLRLRDQNTAILLISADLDELLAISDRFLVIFEGKLVGELLPEEATRERLGMLMAGRAVNAPAR